MQVYKRAMAMVEPYSYLVAGIGWIGAFHVDKDAKWVFLCAGGSASAGDAAAKIGSESMFWRPFRLSRSWIPVRQRNIATLRTCALTHTDPLQGCTAVRDGISCTIVGLGQHGSFS